MAIRFSVTSTTASRISVRVSGLDPNAPYFYRVIFRIDGAIDGDYRNVASSSVSHSFTGLQADTRYMVEVEVWNQDDQRELFWDYYNVRTDGLPPSRPSWIVMDEELTDYNYLVVDWASVPDADGYDVYVDGRYYQTTSLRYAVIDAKPGTSYEVCVRAYNEWGTSSARCGTFRTPSLPGKWNWSYDIYSGGEFYDYSSDGRTVYLMPASEWNNFTSRINEVREYKGLSNYSFTTATRNTSESGIRTCINQAINAINDMLSSSSRMSTISSGSEVRASIFIDMRDKLNSIK